MFTIKFNHAINSIQYGHLRLLLYTTLFAKWQKTKQQNLENEVTT